MNEIDQNVPIIRQAAPRGRGQNHRRADRPGRDRARSAAPFERNQSRLAHVILTPNGELAEGIMMIVGGRHIDFLQGLDTPIGAADDVMLIPPLSGG